MIMIGVNIEIVGKESREDLKELEETFRCNKMSKKLCFTIKRLLKRLISHKKGSSAL